MKRNVLLAVLGLTPQVVTETLYHLTQERKEVVDEICLVTTSEGRELAESELLCHPDGALHRFCQDYGLDCDAIRLAPIVELQGPHQNRPLDDIRTVEENRVAADQIVQTVAMYTSQDDVRLFCSLAGGRKTMSTYAGFAMQLLGRTQDELLHVLVRPRELERRRDFFYPPPNGADFVGRQVPPIRVPGQQIRVDCASVPFVRLREYLPKRLDPTRASYGQLVQATQAVLLEERENVQLVLEARQRRVTVAWGEGGRVSFRLPPKPAALYHMLLEQENPVRADLLYREDAFVKRLQRLYSHVYGKGKQFFQSSVGASDPERTVSKARVRANEAVDNSDLPPFLKELCQIARTRQGPDTFYSIHLSCHRRKVVDLPPSVAA